ITVAEPIVERKRKGRQVMRSVRCDAPAQSLGKIGETPPANAGLSIGRDIRRDDVPERGVEGAPAGVRRAAIFAVGMTLVATRRRGEIGAGRGGVGPGWGPGRPPR